MKLKIQWSIEIPLDPPLQKGEDIVPPFGKGKNSVPPFGKGKRLSSPLWKGGLGGISTQGFSRTK
jgi:hypothetical protein